MAITGYQKFVYGIDFFRDWGLKYSEKHPEYNLLLEKANFDIRTELYVATTMMTSLITAVGWVVLCLFLVFFVFPYIAVNPPKFEVPFVLNIAIFLLTPLVPICAYFILLWWPNNRLGERRKDIDKNLNYAVNYMAAMASADVTPTSIFQGLSKQEIYGEIRAESAKVARDIDFFGKDLILVLQRAMNRSPSIKFQDFIQGIITTSNSGGSLKSYFMAKSEQYLRENRVEQKRTLQTLGVLAESYVTVVVAAPLFLIVMMSVMGMMGNASGITFLWLVTLVMIPLGQFLFIFILSGIKTE